MEGKENKKNDIPKPENKRTHRKSERSKRPSQSQKPEKARRRSSKQTDQNSVSVSNSKSKRGRSQDKIQNQSSAGNLQSLDRSVVSAEPADTSQNILVTVSQHQEKLNCHTHSQPFTLFNESRHELLCDDCPPSPGSILKISAAYENSKTRQGTMINMQLGSKKDELTSQLQKVKAQIQELNLAKVGIEREIRSEFQTILDKVSQKFGDKLAILENTSGMIYSDIRQINDIAMATANRQVSPAEHLLSEKDLIEQMDMIMSKPLRPEVQVSIAQIQQEIRFERESTQAPALKQLLQKKDEILWQVLHPNATSTFITEQMPNNQPGQCITSPTDMYGEIQEWAKLVGKYEDCLDSLSMKCAYCGQIMNASNVNGDCYKNSGYSYTNEEPKVKGAPRHIQGSGRHYFRPLTAQDKNSKQGMFDRLRMCSGLEQKFESLDMSRMGKIQVHDFLFMLRDHVKVDEITINKFIQVYDEQGFVNYVNFLQDMKLEKYILEQFRTKSNSIRRNLKGSEQNGIASSEEFRAALSRAGISENVLSNAVRVSQLHMTGRVPYDVLLNSFKFKSKERLLSEKNSTVAFLVTENERVSFRYELDYASDNSLAFQSLRKKLLPLTDTLPLILYNLKTITRLLKKYMGQCTTTCIKLIVGVCNEARTEFLESFLNDLLPLMVDIGCKRDSAGEMFSALPLCFKYLIKGLVGRGQQVFDICKPAVFHQLSFVKNLIAQALAFVMRKNTSDYERILAENSDYQDLWYVIKHSRLLGKSWVAHSAAEIAHLSLVYDKKCATEVWQSIKANNQIYTLEKWIILCNGNRLPADLKPDIVSFVKSNLPDTALCAVYLIKYHWQTQLLKELLPLDHILFLLEVLFDINDSHPEKELHDRFLGKPEKKNFIKDIDLHEFSRGLSSVVVQNSSDIRRSIFLIHALVSKGWFSHVKAYGKQLQDTLAKCSSSEEVWATLKVANLIGATISIEGVAEDSLDIAVEMAQLRHTIPTFEGEFLRIANENDILPESTEVLLPYLMHPRYRLVALSLLRKMDATYDTALKLLSQETDISNEKNIKQGIRALNTTSSPEIFTRILIGAYWIKFSTIWPSVTKALVNIATTNTSMVWNIIEPLLNEEFAEEEGHSELYWSLAQAPTQVGTRLFRENLFALLVACPTVAKNESFVELFKHFLDGPYSNEYPFPWTANRKLWDIKDPYINKKLLLFLKVCKEVKGKPNSSLRPYFTQFLLKKNEDIRTLSTECLIKYQEQESEEGEILRGLAGDKTIKHTDLPTKAIEQAKRLLASRALYKNQNQSRAFELLACMEQSPFILTLLPVDLTRTNDPFEHHNIKQVQGFLENLHMCVKKLTMSIVDHIGAIISMVGLVLKNGKRALAKRSFKILTSLVDREVLSDFQVEDIFTTVMSCIENLYIEFRPTLVVLILALCQQEKYNSDVFVHICKACSNAALDNTSMQRCLNIMVQYLQAGYKTESQTIAGAVAAGVSKMGYISTFVKILDLVEIDQTYVDVLSLLAKESIKKRDLLVKMPTYMKSLTDPPVTFYVQAAYKNKTAVPIVGAVLPKPLGPLLSDMFSLRVQGLQEEYDYERAVEAIHQCKDLAPSLGNEQLQALVYSLGHLIPGTELGIKYAAAETFKELQKLPQTEIWTRKALSLAIKRAKDDLDVRTALEIYNVRPIGLESMVHQQDLDQNQLLNLLHIQMHRRARAINQLDFSEIPPNILDSILIPVLNYILRTGAHNVIKKLAEACSTIPWPKFYRQLKFAIKKLPDSFTTYSKVINQLLQFRSDVLTEALVDKVLPSLKGFIVDKSDEHRPKLRPHILMAILRISDHMPGIDAGAETSRVLSIIMEYIIHKEQGARATATSCLIKISKKVKTKKFLFMFKQIKGDMGGKLMTKILANCPAPIDTSVVKFAYHYLLESKVMGGFSHLAEKAPANCLETLLGSPIPLTQIALGLPKNPHFQPADIVRVGLEILDYKPEAAKQVEKESKAVANYTVQDGASNGTRPKQVTNISKRNEILLLFGSQLLQTGVKRHMKTEGIPESLANRVREAIDVCLSSKQDEVVINCLSMIQLLSSKRHLDRVLELGVYAGTELTFHILKTISSFEDSVSEYSTPLLALLQVALLTHNNQGIAIRLLRVLVEKRVMSAEIYDVMERVPELLLSQNRLHKQVSDLYIDFLVLYPMTKQRRDVHISFLARNLGVAVPEGRLVLIGLLKTLLEKIPFSEIQGQADFLFLALVTQLANEDDDSIGSVISEVMQTLYKLNTDRQIVQQVFNWAAGDNFGIQKAALVAIKALTPVLGKQMASAYPLALTALSQPDLRLICLEILQDYPDQNSEIEKAIADELAEGRKPNLKSLRSHALDETLIRAVADGTVGEEIDRILDENSYTDAVVHKISHYCRRLLGKKVEDSRFQILMRLLLKVRDPVLPLFNALLLASELGTLDTTKSLANQLFQHLHDILGQETFLNNYNTMKAKIKEKRVARKASAKQLAVTHPEVATAVKLKHRKKARLLKKKKWVA